MKKLILTLSIFLSLAFVNEANAQQQKFGHVNSQELFETMPEVANLRTQLTNKSKQYETQLQGLYTTYQTLVGDLQQNMSSYTEIVLQQKYKEAEDLEKRITNTEAEAQKELQRYEAEKLKPIEDKAFAAIQKVAQANGFTYIFDSSLGVLVYKPASDDITNLVKAQLGIY
ncbi:MAG: OmpH family outer membrane protein [Chitinophagales bacterium]